MGGGEEFKLANLKELAEDFSAEHLKSYTDDLRNSGRRLARKEINDALWGTIALTPCEVAILDSPLLQRLRYIRQLGVVHWIYPGAIHTRFEHTIGVLFQVQNLISALNTVSTSGSDSPIINGNLIQILRLCALLHDIGHAAFSHVSELAVENLPDSALIKAEFSRELQIEHKQFSEIFAYYLIRSQAMKALFEVVLARCGNAITLDQDRNRNLSLLIEKISNSIIGRKIDDRLPLVHELISGPFDADKLDYFARDAKLAGTPLILDISRLVQKLTVRALDSGELPAEISSQVTRLPDKYYIFGVKWSGVAVLDELHLARVLLFAKIYRHTKVIATEQMLRAVILALAKISPIGKVIQLLYTNPDDALLGMNKESLATAVGLQYADLDSIAQERLSHAAAILKAIRDRRLWVRAFQIERRYPGDPLEKATAQSQGLIEFREDVEHVEHRQIFVDSLLIEVKKIQHLLGKPVSDVALESSIMVHALGRTPGGTQINRAYLIPTTGKPIPFREYKVNRQHWADSYLSDQPSGFIFTAPELADVVYVASEKLIRKKYDVRLPDSALEVSKRDSVKIQELKKDLAKSGYYSDAAYDIRPQLERLEKADIPGIIDAFCTIRSSFQEPLLESLGDEIRQLNARDRTLLWLKQFDNDVHVDCALRLLRSFKFLTRSDSIDALKKFINDNPEFKGARVVPLGKSKDSGAIQTYYAADLQGSYISECLTLEEACQKDPLPLIFIDDFAGSGSQVTDVLAAGFGREDDRKELNEQRDLFGDEIQEYLKNVKIGFVFTAAWDKGIKAIIDYVKELELDAVVFRLQNESSIPFAFENCLDGVPQEIVESFKSRCAEIGGAILRSPLQANNEQISVDKPQIEERLLGYGNRAMLLATPYNVPSQTLTAVWAHGILDEIPWVPLLARRKKA